VFHASVLSPGPHLPKADLQAGSWDSGTLEDNGIKWQWDHIFPLPSSTCTTCRRRGPCKPKDQMMPVTPDDNAKKSK